MIFRSRKKPASAAAVAGPSAELAVGRSTDALLAEIEELTRSNRERRDPEAEIRLVALRHAAGIRMLEAASRGADYPQPAFDRLPDRNGELAGITPDQLTPEVVRAGLLRDGCLLVRGLLNREDAAGLVEQIQAAFDAREALQAGRSADGGYYREFTPDPRFIGEEGGRDWVAGGGGLWVADSPHLMFEMLDCFERAGLTRVIRDYLGERPTVSVQKCTLRKVDPDAGHGWHQDGAFMGDVRALNVWLALSRCGDESPGMDIVPKRLDEIVPTGTEGAIFEWSVSPAGGRGGGGRCWHPATDLRTRGRTALRRPVPALDRHGSLDEEEPPGDRELVLRGLRLAGGVRAPRCVTRGPEPRRFFFVHMQKTGGVSLYVRMWRYFGRQAVYPAPSDGSPTKVAPQLFPQVLFERWAERRDEIQVVTGHFPLCTTELLDAEFTTLITVLRHPVERTLSYLRHHRDTTPADRELPLEAIYEDPSRFRPFIENHMVKMLSLRSRGDDATG